jgi:LysR family transcriptional regulator, cyn operon transcriptional activator
VYDEELVLIASPAMRGTLDVSSLARLEGFESLPFVTYQEGDYVFGRWFDGNYGEQPSALRSVAQFSELEEVIDFVRRSKGLSIVPRDARRSGRDLCRPRHAVSQSGIRRHAIGERR